MSAAGHAIGLTADGAEDRPVTEQLEEANRLLYRAASVKTRLARVVNASEEDLAAGGGRRLPLPDGRIWTGRSIPSSKHRRRRYLAPAHGGRSGPTVVWLGGGTAPAGLGPLLAAVRAGEGRCLAMTETVS